jgi:hypothetical protein
LVLASLAAVKDNQINHPSIDSHIKDSEVTLVLSVSLYGTWRPEYHIPMTSLATDKFDVLQKLLRDAQDEISSPKEQLKGVQVMSIERVDSLKVSIAT